jgi:hypothetical protein
MLLVGGKKPFQTSLPAVQLLDETDQGYYILLDGTSRATFISRDRVKGVYFSDKFASELDSLPEMN